MSWFLVILFLSLTFSAVSEASHGTKPASAVVVGTVLCDTCFQQDFSMGSHFISGASVAVECKEANSNSRFRKEVKTDEHGEFKVQLPFSVSKHVKRIKGCTVKLINSSEPYCAVASAASSSSLRLKSRKQGEHIFSAGFFSFKPLKQPNPCNQKPNIQNSKQLKSASEKSAFPPTFDPSFPPPLQDPPTPGAGFPTLPPLPKLPDLPPLPSLPPLPGVPLIPPAPIKAKHSLNKAEPSDQKVARPDLFFPPNPFQPPLIPNPFQPPPLIPNPFQPPPLIPNPFQPPPAPLIPNPFQPPSPPPLIPNPFQPPSPPPLIPNPFQPPPSGPSPLFPFPPIPGFTPSPPPPPPPFFRFPFPFPPLFPPPRSPGTPPASSSKNTMP
ncbi:hypothetical protein L6164_006628 [Bauhinia variegata]|uniref:Uncharacterized protein n=1 Tax=Bauhinia variegata TaxID=167791 RepID=A0ACB9PV24_BAUVA|nr:hypothetical protein L6164_006628 [Bauhinia variegata]